MFSHLKALLLRSTYLIFSFDLQSPKRYVAHVSGFLSCVMCQLWPETDAAAFRFEMRDLGDPHLDLRRWLDGVFYGAGTWPAS